MTLDEAQRLYIRMAEARISRLESENERLSNQLLAAKLELAKRSASLATRSL